MSLEATKEFNIDTVENAAATPKVELPWAELGLKDNEFAEIVKILGRRPTAAELAMYSVMWSEHCSYKSTKNHLRQFGQKVTPEMKKDLMVGMGENAGVTNLGDGWAVTFKIESHNSPSFVEPHQGAATGIGGIVRDIISMGARPIAVMDPLRFGAIDHPDSQRVVHGVVSGIGSYGNSLGLPNIGGETVFDPIYQGNPLVNALAVGALRHEDLRLANASGVGNKVVLFGARTGGDGIGGASVLASESFDDTKPSKRPAVQVGDPFAEKVLIECCLELFKASLVEGIQDLGAAGISCATSELAANGDGGMNVELTSVLLRDPTLTPGEILMSESQERMMAVVTPDNVKAFEAVMDKYAVEYSWLGEVTDDNRLTITWNGEVIVDVDPSTVAVDGPEYDRPYARPQWQDALQADTFKASDAGKNLPATGDEIKAAVLELIASPNMCDKSWITRQYDRYVGGNTALSSPDDAGVVRIDEETGLGVAIATDANGRYTYLDPYLGAQLALAESYRNVATSGAIPIAVSDCLNYGSPEDPDVMWQLAEGIRGLSDACQVLGVPVTGGNVSLYNQTGTTAIHPTPVVATLGKLDDVARRTPSGWREDADGQAIYLIGKTFDELDGSEFANLRGHLGGLPPKVDLDVEKELGEILINASRDGMIDAAHDLSEGGLAAALSEMVLRYGVGARVALDDIKKRDGLDSFTTLFSESQSRAVVAVPRSEEVRFNDMTSARGVTVARLGIVDAQSKSLEVQGEFTVSVEDLREAHEGTMIKYFG
ncbi:phosphoribosylformylglycinamidine synthase subunit PurL [Arthrobacter sp. MYb213]|uniref:phosphoribosylformylglycinamidine synthase subunit PurL n=1 Tax=Arthrobacter sp. MYb213 TaxID=1848595 RepID=UPI000CFCD25D|nr:phosphoribosylformylglycinamidine synthase subunit PurL [Arthrobacter sp. MYb213]PRB69331.1 phosphoribosylformylglycinamidine synthase II [Arthrobacter sp. MYb213]